MSEFRAICWSTALLGCAVAFGFCSPVLAQPGTGFPSGEPRLLIAQTSGTVLELQRELNRLGYGAGPEDGLMGARTREAIEAYQREHDLLVDGRASGALLSHVRATAQARTPAAPVPLPPGFVPVSQLVADIQEALRSLGYDAPAPSGRLTEATRDAIRAYEADRGLLVSGEPSAELLEHMRRRIADQQPAPAVDADTIAGIQAELRRRGYAIAVVSGRMDTQTREAIREYQQGRGVPVTGKPSPALLAELRAADAEPITDPVVTRDQRAAAQRILNARGYGAGPPDGVLGPRSRDAIRTFQADHDLPPTGELTSRTLELLGIDVASEVPVAEPRPFRVRVHDAFADGDYTRDPAWRVASGQFEVRGGGLTSVIVPPSARPEDIGRQLLGGLLQQQLGITIPGQESAAVAYLPTRITQEFRVTAVVSGSAESFGHIDLGPYASDILNHGYRLSYRASQTRPLQLLLVDESGTSVIASARLDAASGRSHRLVWERDGDGRMRVSSDGEMLIDVVDRNLESDFEGFSLINGGGEWTLHEVTVEDRR
ncbi:Peptidoglycan-binding domain 1 [Thioalkalivibrio nitratireducens DSM 14787]|uniref:Peptidoglycan-binding domain 1 n=1 Tax=Thioalkalivibrio nitratireducens (strain DSM 14787 / UNIQEM 213 / ALEN2) TaxID=1255043 RepID=L0E165_THIND|nr:peptidoglycan-binding protein [Thioalkalivibrio nitratireducens]AGA34987.1 Peptidoglycan-binding domain 1 [Thioalkalivibrio nitratireducens DSM 14787]